MSLDGISFGAPDIGFGSTPSITLNSNEEDLCPPPPYSYGNAEDSAPPPAYNLVAFNPAYDIPPSESCPPTSGSGRRESDSDGYRPLRSANESCIARPVPTPPSAPPEPAIAPESDSSEYESAGEEQSDPENVPERELMQAWREQYGAGGPSTGYRPLRPSPTPMRIPGQPREYRPLRNPAEFRNPHPVVTVEDNSDSGTEGAGHSDEDNESQPVNDDETPSNEDENDATGSSDGQSVEDAGNPSTEESYDIGSRSARLLQAFQRRGGSYSSSRPYRPLRSAAEFGGPRPVLTRERSVSVADSGSPTTDEGNNTSNSSAPFSIQHRSGSTPALSTTQDSTSSSSSRPYRPLRSSAEFRRPPTSPSPSIQSSSSNSSVLPSRPSFSETREIISRMYPMPDRLNENDRRSSEPTLSEQSSSGRFSTPQQRPYIPLRSAAEFNRSRRPTSSSPPAVSPSAPERDLGGDRRPSLPQLRVHLPPVVTEHAEPTPPARERSPSPEPQPTPEVTTSYTNDSRQERGRSTQPRPYIPLRSGAEFNNSRRSVDSPDYRVAPSAPQRLQDLGVDPPPGYQSALAMPKPLRSSRSPVTQPEAPPTYEAWLQSEFGWINYWYSR